MIKYLFDDIPAAGELREVASGVFWLRMPLPLALDHINLYLLEDTDGWWIIDTGISHGPTQALWETIFSTYLGDKPVKAVLATHWHPDHLGMAGWLCDRWRATFYMTQAEYLSGLTYSRMTTEHFGWANEVHQVRLGRTPEQIAAGRISNSGMSEICRPMPTSYRRLEDGDWLTINGVRWRIVVGNGHSPEHACLFSDSLNVLISGDQVIPRITSNVSVGGNEPEGNPLKEWLGSHERFLELLPDDALVLPAHNAPFFGLHYRLRYLIDHHEDHLLALEDACAKRPSNTQELLPVLFKRELDDNHINLALGECLAHLNFLLQRGQIERTIDERGVYLYRSIDDTLPLRLRQRDFEADEQGPLQV